MCGKRVKYIYWVKKDLFGCFRIEENETTTNETGLKEGGGKEMSTTVLHLCAAPSFKYLPVRVSSEDPPIENEPAGTAVGAVDPAGQ